MPAADRPLVVHLLNRFATGGLENGVVNLINRMPQFRHAVVAVTEVTEFKARVTAPDVQFHALHKPPGQGLWLYPKLWRLLRELRPAVVHTRNLGAMELLIPAWAAGVPLRLHSEHGWDMDDLGGSNPRYRRMRRFYARFAHHFIALSGAIQEYLRGPVGLAPDRVSRICNGVDTERFHPGATPPADWPFRRGEHLVIGTVGRQQQVKDPLALVEAFLQLRTRCPAHWPRLRLAMLGDGPLLAQARARLAEAGAAEQSWLPGDRSDVPALLPQFDIFALPSRAEGISNTLLEAGACGCARVATRVGGNEELIKDEATGLLVPAENSEALAAALARLIETPSLRESLARDGLAEVRQRFGLDVMVAAYASLYGGREHPHPWG
jgi:sugar transferase (PEP-CTERM/EpsH1 system associated)